MRVRSVWRSRRRTKGSRIRTSDRSRQHAAFVVVVWESSRDSVSGDGRPYLFHVYSFG